MDTAFLERTKSRSRDQSYSSHEMKKATEKQVLVAVQELGKALRALQRRNRALEAYKASIYPEGATIREEHTLEGDPKFIALWRKVNKEETVEHLLRCSLDSLAKRFYPKKKK